MKYRHALLSVLCATALPLVASAAESAAQQIVAHHLEASGKGDVEAVAADYADNAILILPDTVVRGKKAIRETFAKLLTPGASQLAPVVTEKRVFEGDIGYIVWTQNAGKPGEVRGSDTFVVRNGKIVTQTVMMVPK